MNINFDFGTITKITLESNKYIDLYILRTSNGFSISFSDDTVPAYIYEYVTNEPYTKYELHELYERYEWEVGE